MKVAIIVVAFAEILALFASVVALVVLGIRKLVRSLRSLGRADEDVSPAGHAFVSAGKGNAIDSVNMWLKDVGMQVSEQDALKITAAVKAHSLKGNKMLTHAEFRDVARATLGRTQAAAE